MALTYAIFHGKTEDVLALIPIYKELGKLGSKQKNDLTVLDFAKEIQNQDVMDALTKA